MDRIPSSDMQLRRFVDYALPASRLRLYYMQVRRSLLAGNKYLIIHEIKIINLP